MVTELACTYDATADRWLVRVPFALPAGPLRYIRDYLIRINTDRWRSCGPGDKKERLGVALQALTEGRIAQILTNKGDQVLFQSTERMHPDRTIFI